MARGGANPSPDLNPNARPVGPLPLPLTPLPLTLTPPPWSERQANWHAAALDSLVEGLLVKDPKRRLGCGADGWRELQRHRFFKGLDWAVLDMRKAPSPLKREWYIREVDLTMSRQFRNGEDIALVVEKLQAMALDGTTKPGHEASPGMVPGWDYVNPRAVYSEYVSSPYLNYKLPLQF